MQKKLLRLLALMASLALLFAACGDDDGETTETGDDTETTEADAADDTESTEAEDDAMEEEGDDADAEDDAMEEEGDDAAASGETLNVGVKFDQPLFGVNGPDGVVGFDAEIAEAIGAALGRPVEFQEAVSANRETFLEQGTVDIVVATYTINDERKERVSFAGPYYVAGQDIMVPAGNPNGIGGIEDLNSSDITVCTAEGSTSLENLQSMAPDADIVTFDAYSKCADAMGQGRADAVSTDNVILLGLVQESDGEFELVGNPFTEEPYGIGTPLDSPLRCEINTILQGLYDDGTWASAYESTIGTVSPGTPEPPAIDTEGC